MRKYLSTMSITLAAAFVMLLICQTSLAQPRAARGRVYTKADVEVIIKRVEDRSDKFKKEFDKALDHSRLNNTNREDHLNQFAKDLEKATDELRSEFDRRDAWIESKDEVKACLAAASKIDVAMRKRRLGSDAERTWAALRYELNTLADVYDLPRVNIVKPEP